MSDIAFRENLIVASLLINSVEKYHYWPPGRSSDALSTFLGKMITFRTEPVASISKNPATIIALSYFLGDILTLIIRIEKLRLMICISGHYSMLS